MRAPGPLPLGLLLWAIASLACAPAPPGPPAAAPAAPAAAPDAPAPAPTPAQPQRGGTLAYGTIVSTSSLHPLKGRWTDVLRHVGPAYENLLSFDYQQGKDHRIDFKVVPWLAERWEQPDPTTYVFHLRKGVKWHDGEEFSAADVVRTFQWTREENFPTASIVRQVTTLETPDRYTVKAALRVPDAAFLENLADKELLIVPKHAIDGGVDLNKTIVGTGPFKLRSFESGRETVWARNADYWQAGNPYPDGIRQFWGADDAIMTAAFVTGKNDLLSVPDRAQLEAVLKQKPDAAYKFEINDSGLVFYPQLERPPFDDLRVRRALHLALDRQALVKQLTFGDGSFGPPLMPGWRTGWAISQEELARLPGYRQPKETDQAEARRLLTEAGYPNGLTFKLMYNNQGVAVPRVAVASEPHFRTVGLNAQLEPAEAAVVTRRQRERQFDLTVVVTTRANYAGLDGRFHSKGSLNENGIQDPKLDEMIERFGAAQAAEDRRRLGLEMQRYLLEQVYAIPTIDLAVAGMWQPWVKDYVLVSPTSVIPHQSTVSRWWLDQKLMPKDR